jgi:hypothetical protein
MPDKPIWFGRLEEAIQQLEALPYPWVDRASIEIVLGVGRRRAQQILQPLLSRQVGRNGLAPRERVIQHLRHLAAGESAFFEKQRQRRFSTALSRLREEAQRQPRVLVEAPTTVVNQDFEDLPAGVHLGPGQILIDGFRTPEEALKKMLALVMAMGNDPLGFESRISVR